MKTCSKLFVSLSLTLICSCHAPNNIEHNYNDKNSTIKLNFNVKDATYNEEAYLIAFPDIAKAVLYKLYGLTTGYDHYIRTGQAEGRLNLSSYIQAKQDVDLGFNEQAYLLAFPDIANVISNPNNIYGLKSGYQHYSVSGKNEGRISLSAYILAKQAVDAGFNEKAYLLAFSDIANVVSNPNNIYGLKSGYQHYASTGQFEGRISSSAYILAKQAVDAGFNEKAYLRAFPDIANVISNPNNIYGLKSGYQHYISAGKNEGRLNTSSYLDSMRFFLDGNKQVNTISFGNSSNTSAKYVEISSPTTQANPGVPITLTAKAFNNSGVEIPDNTSNDKWIWSASPLTPFKGLLDYNGSNTTTFTSGSSAGTVTITAKSKLTGKTSSIVLTIPDVDPKVESITPTDNTLTLPSNNDTISNINISSASTITSLSVNFTDENKDWASPSQITTAYERNIGISGSGISTNVNSSQMNNYDIYVGGFTNSNVSHYINSYSAQLSADKRSFIISPSFISSGTNSGYIVINARQNGVVKRKHRFNITTG